MSNKGSTFVSTGDYVPPTRVQLVYAAVARVLARTIVSELRFPDAVMRAHQPDCCVYDLDWAKDGVDVTCAHLRTLYLVRLSFEDFYPRHFKVRFEGYSEWGPAKDWQVKDQAVANHWLDMVQARRQMLFQIA
jgi:hypothetical protein